MAGNAFETPGKPGGKPPATPDDGDDEPTLEELKRAAAAAKGARKRKGAILAKKAKHENWARQPDILEFIEKCAADGQTQRTIAALLGKPLRTFEEALAANKNDNPLRLAYERGVAEEDQDAIDIGMSLDPRNPKQAIPWIFFRKTRGWKDRHDTPPQDGPRITYVLPDSLSPEAYYKRLGMTGPDDLRDQKAKDAMKDITPYVAPDGKLAVLGPPSASPAPMPVMSAPSPTTVPVIKGGQP